MGADVWLCVDCRRPIGTRERSPWWPRCQACARRVAQQRQALRDWLYEQVRIGAGST